MSIFRQHKARAITSFVPAFILNSLDCRAEERAREQKELKEIFNEVTVSASSKTSSGSSLYSFVYAYKCPCTLP